MMHGQCPIPLKRFPDAMYHEKDRIERERGEPFSTEEFEAFRKDWFERHPEDRHEHR